MFGHHVLVVDTVIWDLGLGLTYRDNKDFHLDVGVGVVVRQGSQGEQEGPPWIAQSVPSRCSAGALMPCSKVACLSPLSMAGQNLRRWEKWASNS